MDNKHYLNQYFKKGLQPYKSLLGNQQHPESGYKISAGLADAVYIALRTGKPLLLTGEPGTGKTALAYYLRDKLDTKLFRYNIKTTTTSKDLFYQYDALGHFRLAQQEPLDDDTVAKLFIRYQALGEAILYGRDKEKRAIVLLDEIDKAPRDLPNDMLFEIEEMKFEVPEVKKVDKDAIEADTDYRPIVIMTSNSEKDFPDAFLRRCVYFHIEFPDDDLMTQIFEAKLKVEEEEAKAATKHLKQIRENALYKPATEEALQWAAYLKDRGVPLENVNELKLQKHREELNASYSILAKNKQDLKAFRREQ